MRASSVLIYGVHKAYGNFPLPLEKKRKTEPSARKPNRLASSPTFPAIDRVASAQAVNGRARYTDFTGGKMGTARSL